MGKPKTNNDELKKELEDLKARVIRIEGHLGITPIQAASENPLPPPPPPPK